jgi:hypothetical protein
VPRGFHHAVPLLSRDEQRVFADPPLMAMTQAISEFLRAKHPDCKGISSCSLRACAIAIAYFVGNVD